MNKLYLVTHSHIDFRNGGIRAHADVFTNKDNAIDKILNIHHELCVICSNYSITHNFQFSKRFIKYAHLNDNPCVINCKDCVFENDNDKEKCKIIKEHNDNVTFEDEEAVEVEDEEVEDEEVEVDNEGNDIIYNRHYCLKCQNNEQILLEKCMCQYFKYINSELYKRIICNNCAKYCNTDCGFGIYHFTESILDDETEGCYSSFEGYEEHRIPVKITISKLTDNLDCSTNWNA